jgi:hypothetical protein
MLKAILVVGAVATAACTSMRRVEPTEYIPRNSPRSVSVWTAPNRVTIVSDPEIQGDTLVGTVLQARWAVGLHDVVRVEANTPDPTRTVLLVASAAASGLGLYLVSAAGKGAGSVPCPPDFPPSYKTELCGLH